DAADDRNVAAGADGREAEREGLARLDRDAFPHRDRCAVERRLHICAADSHDAVTLELEGRPDELAFEPGIRGIVADEKIGEAEGPAVHRTRGRKPLRPVADSPRIVLD